MDEVTLVRGRWVITGAGESEPVLSDGALAVEGERIREVGSWRDLRSRYPEAPVLGSERTAVLPGLINAHHHSSGASTIQHGVPDRLLEPWILSLGARRPSDSYLDTLVSSARLLRTGVTAVVDVESTGGRPEAYAEEMGRALRAHTETGLRVAFAAGVKNRSHLVAGEGEDRRFLDSLPAALRDEVSASLPQPGDIGPDAYLDLMADWARAYGAHRRVRVWYGPPGPQWVSDDFMLRIAEEAARFDTGVQTHVVESLYEKLHGPRFYGKPTVLHLRELGVLGPRFSIAHGVWLTEPEIAALAETGAGVVHNPSSNLRLRAGIAPVNALLEAGVSTALGMDGTTLNEDEDMFTEMRLAVRLHRTPEVGGPAPRVADGLGLATAGGARLLRETERLGRLAPGYQADLALVDLARVTWPWVAPEADPRELVLLRARAGDVDTVLVGGETVLRAGRPTRFDAEGAARELAERLAAAPYPEETARRVAALRPHLEAWYAGWEVPALSPYVRYNSRD